MLKNEIEEKRRPPKPLARLRKRRNDVGRRRKLPMPNTWSKRQCANCSGTESASPRKQLDVRALTVQ